jgi:hypothetical protein
VKNNTPGNIPHLKTRTLGQMTAAAFVLIGYSMLNSIAYAYSLDCPIKGVWHIKSSNHVLNRQSCEIVTPSDQLWNYGRLDNSSSLTNGGFLTNEGFLNNFGTLNNFGILYNKYSGILNNTFRLTNYGKLENYGKLYSNRVLTNSGTLNNIQVLTNSGTLNNNQELTNSGTLYNNQVLTNTGKLYNNRVLTNSGKLYNNRVLTNSGTLNNFQELTNTGTLINFGLLMNGGFADILSEGELTGGGTFIQTDGTLNVDGTMSQANVNINSGSLSGTGTIQSSKITIGEEATVKPGNYSAGTLIMMGDVDFLGTLRTEIIDTNLFDMLEVQGAMVLSANSTFEFMFGSSFMAVHDYSFKFLSAFDFDFSLSDSFDNWFNVSRFNVSGLAAGFGWSVSFTDNVANQEMSYLSMKLLDNGLTSNPVSAPATLVLFSSALLIMGWGTRRRNKLC